MPTKALLWDNTSNMMQFTHVQNVMQCTRMNLTKYSSLFTKPVKKTSHQAVL